MPDSDAVTEKSEIIGICFSQVIEIFQENSSIAIYFLHRKRSAVINNKESLL